MFLKIIGIVIVVIASTLIGFGLAKRLEERLKDLRTLGLALKILEREIMFLSNSLPQALTTASKAGRSVSNIFGECGEILRSKQGYCVSEAWKISIDKHISSTFLNDDDKQILLSLGKNLGAYDIENQIQSIKLIAAQLQQQEQSVKELISKNSKMYKQLGVLGGIAIAIVLL